MPRLGVENMSIDQEMLQQTNRDGLLRLRIYRWKEPTVSLGYFQKLSDFQTFQGQHSLPVVRRSTGGGAIVHHHDWTYSIAIPGELAGGNALGASALLYDCMHRAVIGWLASRSVVARKWTDKTLQVTPQSSVKAADNTNTAPESPSDAPAASCTPKACNFLCFERRTAGDVVVDLSAAGLVGTQPVGTQHFRSKDAKVMGSAQRRLGGSLLQHGSLLLRTSPFAPSLLGLFELAGREFEDYLSDFSGALVSALMTQFSIQFQSIDSGQPLAPISDEVRSRVETLAWTARI